MTTLIHPPITGDPQLDSWTYRLTSLINQGLNAGEISASQSSVDSGSTALFLYQRSTSNSTAPTLPTSVVYNFENSPIVSSADNGWTSTIPTTGGDNIWVTLRYVAARSGTITGSNSWNTAALLGTGGGDGADGVDGDDGKSVAALSIYKRSSSAISQAPTGGNYNFNTNTISPPTGWSASIPSGTGTVYISLSTATSAAGGTGTDSSLTWGVPDLYLQDGTDARSTYQALIFKRDTSAPSTPTSGSFNFGTNTLTTPTGWSAGTPSGTDPTYASRGLFAVSGDTGTDSTISWSAPELFVENGGDGADGLSTYFFPIYKRSSSTISSAPTGGSYNFGSNAGTPPTGWSTTVPAGTNPLYVSTTVASVQGTTATDSSLTWSTPVILSQNGADGIDGSSIAFVSIYQRASSAPSAPSSGGSYNFTNDTLTAPNNWYTSVPSGSNPVYMSVSTATSSAGGGGTDSTLSWGTPTLLVQNGTDGGPGAAGSDGVSTYQAIVFQRATSAPSAPTDGSFNFGNNTLTNPTGWSDTVPSGNNPIYATRNLFSISGDTGTDTSVSWSTPAKFVEDGTDGADGLSTFLFPIYIRASSAPSAPTGGGYNFGTNSGTAPSGWSTSVPSGTNPVYISTSLATVQGATGSDTSLTWSSPQILAQNGTDGEDGEDGADAPRLAQRIIYTNPAVATAPSAPAATVTWSTGALSGMSSGWSESPPTQSATSSDSVYSSVIVFNDTSGSATTTTATGATPVKATEFSGLVTFSSGDFSLDGSTITNIDGGNITTGSVNAGALTSGNLAVDSNAIPTSGSGAKLTSNGDVTFGSTDRYVAWDESSADLRIQGDIINVSETSSGVVSTGWVQIDTSQSLTNVMSALGGAGPFAFIMVGGGGGGAACGFLNTGSNKNQPRYNTVAHAGGASGYATWIYEWDGTTAVSVALGTGGVGGHKNQNNAYQRMTVADGVIGNASTFSVGGTTVVTTNPGRGGGNSFSANVSPNTANSGTNGPGGGGTVSITTSSTLSSLAEYTGGAGGNGFTETHEDFGGNIDSANNSALWGSPGGGGVRAFANVSNTAGGNKVGGSGGGPFGPGIGGSNLGTGNQTSDEAYAGAGLPATFSSSASVTNSGNANAGSNNITGVFVTDGPGSAAAGNTVGNTNAASNGMLGGGGRAGSTDNGNFKGSSGGVFGGGGGITIGGIQENTAAGHWADGGNGGFGGGGGASYARQSRGGDGGDGVLYIKKL